MRALRNIAAVAVVSALVAFGQAGTAHAQSSVPRRVVVRADSMVLLDSTFRIMINPMPLELMLRELMSSRAMEETVVRALREASTGQKADSDRTRVLQRSLESIARRNMGLRSAIQMQCSQQPTAEPPGYLGVQFEETMVSRQNNEPAVYELGSRPTIASVTPGSPADKAGIRHGDVVLSIGGHDAHRIQLESLLKPGTKLTVRLRRDSDTKSVDVLVEKRPEDYGFMTCTRASDLFGEDAPPMIVVPRMPGGGGGGAGPRPPAVRVTDVPRMAAEGGSSFYFTTPSPAFENFAGATLRTLTDDWKETLGVEKGILVAEVPTSSLARENGLRGGDVIVSVNGTAITTTRQFQRFLNDSEERSFKLVIVRQKKQQTVTLTLRSR